MARKQSPHFPSINAIFCWQKVLLHRNEFAHRYRLSPVYPNCPVFSCYSIFTDDSSHCPCFTCSLKIPQAVSLFYHRLPKSFSEEYWSQEDFLFPCPHRVTTFSVGRSGSTRVIHSPVLNITSSTGEECQLFASYPDVTLSPRFSHDKPTLSRFSQNLNMVIKFRESKWRWKKKVTHTSALSLALRDAFSPCISSYPVDRMLPDFWRGVQPLSCTAAFKRRGGCASATHTAVKPKPYLGLHSDFGTCVPLFCIWILVNNHSTGKFLICCWWWWSITLFRAYFLDISCKPVVTWWLGCI